MFISAKPVWIAGREEERNVYAVFAADVETSKPAELHIAGTVFYRISVNGKFLGCGPARAAKGYVREDVFSLDGFLQNGKCEIIIEASGYGCRSLSTAFQPSCILAEVRAEGGAVVYTGKDFYGYLPGCRIQRAERYSIHRHFCEVWDYRGVKTLTDETYRAEVVCTQSRHKVLERRVPYPGYMRRNLTGSLFTGDFAFDERLPFQKCRYPWEIPDWWGRFEWEEIPYHPYEWLQRQKQQITAEGKELPLALHEGEYAIFDFSQIEVGFIRTFFKVQMESDIVIGFSEYYNGSTFRLPNMDVHNVLEYLLSKGDEREIVSFEPYAFRFLIIMVKSGAVEIDGVGVRSYEFGGPDIALPCCGDKILDSVCKAAVRTFRHNAVDLYTDCPSRERAGWLCDSYFTARTEYAMTGKTVIEEAFLENYVLYKNEGELPSGMLPEAYPSDVRPGAEFIPQWTLWYILEIYEYIFLRGHREEAEKFRKSVEGLFGFFEAYENSDGLLERLPSRNFIEWSKANDWTWDVNYPTNFLYSAALGAAYMLYGNESYREKCERVRKTAIDQSFNGSFFLDHAVRDETGSLTVVDDHSETCQYYAVLFAGINMESEEMSFLKKLILEVFSEEGQAQEAGFVPVNAFMGAYLRLDVLLGLKEYALILKDVKHFFGNMADHTGTLWENRQFEGSYDHGFASYAYVVIEKAMKQKAMKQKGADI